MKHIALVATYHKTGTVWMLSVFKQLAKRLDFPLYNISDEAMCPTLAEKRALLDTATSAGDPCVIFEHHSKFPLDGLDLTDVRGIRLVRDPRDLLISAAKYHTWSKEKWLHRPSRTFDGKTYAETINSLASFDDQVLHELQHASGRTIDKMLAFDDFGVFQTVHFEDLMTDTEMFLWHRICVDLGFEGEELGRCLTVFYKNSVFGGANNKHIQSGTVKQFETAFNPRLDAAFRARFPDALSRLGYE